MLSNFAGAMLSRGGTGTATGFSGMAGMMSAASSRGTNGLSLQQTSRSRAQPSGNNLAERMPEMLVATQLKQNQKRSRGVFV